VRSHRLTLERANSGEAGFQEIGSESKHHPSPIADQMPGGIKMQLFSPHVYNDCLHADKIWRQDATEQFVGLGKPAIAIPGIGPQFTAAFAEAQSRHLGPSLILVEQPTQVATVVQSLLRDPERLQLIAENGVRRMGEADRQSHRRPFNGTVGRSDPLQHCP